MSFADDTTITSTHTSTTAVKKYIQPYLRKVFACTKHYNFTLNQTKQLSLCSFHTLRPKINNTALPMVTHPKVLGFTLYPNHTAHIFITSQHTNTNHNRMGKQKEIPMAIYKAVMRPALEYASSIWFPLSFSTSNNKLQVMQNTSLRTATGCTQYINIQQLFQIILIQSHYAPFVTLMHTTHIISSTAPTYPPNSHFHPWICGQTPLE